MQEEYIGDEFSQGIMHGMMRSKGYIVKDGLILKSNKVFLISKFEVKDKVLHALHNTPHVIHLWFTKIYKLIRLRFVWKGLK